MTSSSSWQQRFFLLSIGQGVSMLTSAILQMSIIWYVTEKTGSASMVAMSTLFGYLPRGILGMFTGAFIDRFDRKKILIISDIGIALAALPLALVAIWMDVPMWLIFSLLFARSVGTAFHTPAFDSIVPSIVPKDSLVRCAGITQTFKSLSLILSPALAAVFYSLWGLSVVVFIDIGGALIGVTIVLFIYIPSHRRRETKERIHVLQDTKEGFYVLQEKKGLLTIMVISALYAFIYFPIGSFYPVITMTYFGGSVADSSVVEIFFAGGSLLGSVLVGIFARKLKRVEVISASIGIYGVGVLTTGLLPPEGLGVFMVLSGLMGITIPFFHALVMAIYQTNVDDDHMGRVLSFSNSATLFVAPLGLFFGSFLSESFGLNYCFLIVGILAVALGLTTLLMPSVRIYTKV